MGWVLKCRAAHPYQNDCQVTPARVFHLRLGGIWNSIVSVPDHCLSIYFLYGRIYFLKSKIFKKPVVIMFKPEKYSVSNIKVLHSGRKQLVLI